MQHEIDRLRLLADRVPPLEREVERLRRENESLRDRIAGLIAAPGIGVDSCVCEVIGGELIIDPAKCKAIQHCWPDCDDCSMPAGKHDIRCPQRDPGITTP